MKTTTLVLAGAFNSMLMLIPTLGHSDEPQIDEAVHQEALVPVEETSRDWVSAYLADNLSYTEEQIQDFKSNVAEMPEEQLRTLLRRLEFTANMNARNSVVSASAHQVNLQRMNAAKAEAQWRVSPQAPTLGYGYQNRQHHSGWNNSPGNYGLFRGYSVVLWNRF